MILKSEHIRIDPAYRDALTQCGLVTVDAILDRTGDRVVAWSRTTDTVYVASGEAQPGFYVKRYFYRSWRKRMRGMLRGTFFGLHRGQAEARALESMRRRGIPAVRPVAWGVRRIGHFVTASFLVTEEVPEARNLTSFACAVRNQLIELSPRQRLTLCHRLADQVAALHTAGFVHGQLFWRNILVRTGLSEEPEFFFLDARPLVRYSGMNLLTSWQRAELAQLAASARPFTSRADRLRFARRYFRTDHFGPQQQLELRETDNRARRYAKHELQRIKMNGRFDAWNHELEHEMALENAAAYGATASSPTGASADGRPA